MRSRIMMLVMLLCMAGNAFSQVPEKTKTDSIKAASINREAENPDFIHAYILDISAGEVYYSTCGHEAIRLVCPSKNLDYCFSFEIDMNVSSSLDIVRSKAKAGYGMIPSDLFIGQYIREGRGVTAYELNLTPKEKQELWRFLDKNVERGPVWTFDYTSINCLSMVLYAISSAIMPEQIDFKNLPGITRASFSDWLDYTTRQSPWFNLFMHATLFSVDDSGVTPEDRIIPEMMSDLMPKAVITNTELGTSRPLTIGAPMVLSKQTYTDHPFWLRPWMALCMVGCFVGWLFGCLVIRKKK